MISGKQSNIYIDMFYFKADFHLLLYSESTLPATISQFRYQLYTIPLLLNHAQTIFSFNSIMRLV